MSKTKYIKVAVSETPKTEKYYFIIYKSGVTDKCKYDLKNSIWRVKNIDLLDYIDFWLEEVPDREQEMKDAIEDLIYDLEHPRYAEDTEESIMKAKELLNSIKE